MIDLHTHSLVSDGSDSPAAVMDLADRAGCTAVALTDHDRLDGLKEAEPRAQELGIRLIPGCEISCHWDLGAMHVLVYFVTDGDGPLQHELVRLQAVRNTRNQRMVEALRDEGIDITLAEVEEEAGGSGVGRPHMAAVLIAKGHAASISHAFDRWLGQGRPGYVEKERLSPAQAMALARDSGGVPVLAHPLSLGLTGDNLRRALVDLAAVGLQGVEAIYGRYSPTDRQMLAAMGLSAGLAITGGSDHHGRYKPDLTVGTGTGDLDVPDELLDLLEQRRP